MVAQDQQRRSVELVAVERVLRRDALAPADALVGRDLEQDDVTRRLDAERRPERTHQRHRDLVRDNALDPHDETSMT